MNNLSDLRKKFEEILCNNGIYGEEVTDILTSVQEMLEYMAADTEEKYPYAKNSVEGYKKAALEVFSLISELN